MNWREQGPGRGEINLNCDRLGHNKNPARPIDRLSGVFAFDGSPAP